MTNIEVSGNKSYVRPQKIRPPKVDPNGLFLSIIKQRLKAAKDTQIAAFKRLVLRDDDVIEKILDEWISLRYTMLLRMANPPTAAELKRRQAVLAAERAQTDERMRESFLRRIWEFAMPDGKRAHECTLQQVADQFSSLAAAITAAGKGKMNKRTDTVFKSPEEFDAALKKAGHV